MIAVATTPACAEEADSADPFTLGQIIVTAPRTDGIGIEGSTLSSDAIYTFNRNSLDDAANLIPGVTSGNSGGSRNERLIFVRGFDRFQVPLSIDGIRVYLPADNRLDYGRFLTPDIAEIQVAKGYPSVLDGPGEMGGAVNLVTRKPSQALEVEARGTLSLDRDVDYAGYNVFGLIGTRQEKWYAQVSFTRNFRDHWDLSGKFTPTVNEDGGERDFSRTGDWRVNVKLGFTPNETDEYAINYTRQEGSKNAPLHVTDDFVPPITPGTPTARFWRWPYWNIENIYFLSTTALGDEATLKTRVYRNKFGNLLRSFDDRTQTTQNSPMPRVFNSPYFDSAWGGSAQLDVDLTSTNRTSLAVHYRRDKHVEAQQTFPAGVPCGFTEPPQENLEDTFSIAAENQFTFSPGLTLTAGVSYDWRDIKKAEEFGAPPGGGQPAVQLSAAQHQRVQLAIETRMEAGRRNELSSERITPRALPDHIRAVQHAVRHGRLQPRPEAGARDQLRARRFARLRRTAAGGRRLLQQDRPGDRLGPSGGLVRDHDAARESGRRGLLWRRAFGQPAGHILIPAGRELFLHPPLVRHPAPAGQHPAGGVRADRRTLAQGLRLCELVAGRQPPCGSQRRDRVGSHDAGLDHADPAGHPLILSHRQLCAGQSPRRFRRAGGRDARLGRAQSVR